MVKTTKVRRRGFSLVELVVVVIIMGMIASMAIPRMGRGAIGANEAAVTGDLNIIRKALLWYATEHRENFPGPDADAVVNQLTRFSDLGGATSPTRTGTFTFGPYLLRIPPCPIGHFPDSNKIAIDAANSPPLDQPASGAGWIYNPNTGEFYPNATAAQLGELLPNLASAVELGG